MIVNSLFYVSPIFAAIAFLVSLTVFFSPGALLYLRIFSVFLLINFITEAVAGYYAMRGINNLVLGNLFTVMDLTFYCYLLWMIIRKPRARRILLYCFLSYPVLFIVNVLLVQRSGVFHSMTYSLGCVVIIFFCIYYFWELFQQTYSVSLGRQPAFWICSGLLFYYACTFPVYGSTNLLEVLPVAIRENLLTILVSLNILLYLSFTIAFLCRLKTRKSMS